MRPVFDGKPAMSESLSAINQLKQQMQLSVLGQEHVVDSLIIAMLANGNVLLEGLPGTAKTRSIKTMAKVLEADLGRIQFTADLLPSDVTGTEIFQEVDGKQLLTFREGPVFNNLVLADEINRAPAKVQGALLEAMEERQITVAGNTHTLPELFMVLATQNPIEQEGTYPLPEAQMDRFLMKVNIDYPDDKTELGIMRLVRGEEQPKSTAKQVKIEQQAVFAARDEIHAMHISENVENYMVALVMATRKPERYEGDLRKWIEVGSSPRASIALDKSSRAYAWMQGKDFVDPDDVRSVVHAVLRHRLILSYEAVADGISSDQVVDEIVKQVAVV
jgi:MoxR-like ATPase